MNVVTGPIGEPSAVLIRALEPVAGIDLIRARRSSVKRDVDLTAGPARCTQALGVDRALDGCDVSIGRVRLVARKGPPPELVCGPRIGIRTATERPWRFAETGNRWVSGVKYSFVPVAPVGSVFGS
jgi:DNA-3-methyladenine glycosylase